MEASKGIGAGHYHHERVVLETDRHRIRGTVTLLPSGSRRRVSDVLNESGHDFMVLTDATVEPLDGGSPKRHAFLAVSLKHVVYVVGEARP